MGYFDINFFLQPKFKNVVQVNKPEDSTYLWLEICFPGT